MKSFLPLASQRPSLRHFEQTLCPLALSKWGSFSSVFLRFALGLSFLSAVADRFGLWGQFGQPNVAWGNFSRFVEYTGRLTSYLPPRMTLTLAVISTGAEILFGLLLLVGWHTRTAALLSGLLLMAFGLAMALALGAKAPLDFSVSSEAGGALLPAGCERFPSAWMASCYSDRAEHKGRGWDWTYRFGPRGYQRAPRSQHRQARSFGWNSPGRNGTRSLVEAARVRRTRKEHPLRLQTREIL
jgi:uncharacterized membrane protein YphA (DoxX/SURF4 family)